MSDKNRIIIFDTTMRDGEQSPGASMSLEEKLQISRVFDELGVDVIEAGFPIASPGDFEAVTEISKTLKRSIPAGLARATKKDIDACHEALRHAKNFRIHTFISTSSLHMKHKLNKSPEEVLDSIKDSVSYARKFNNDNLRFEVRDMRKSFCESEFDAIFNLFTSFGYFESKTENLKVLKAIETMLKDNGVFVIDFMNANKVIRNLVREETKSIDHISFRLKRSYKNGNIVKTIDFTDKENDFHFTEKVQALYLEDFQSLISQTNLKIDSIFGDYNLNPFDKEISDRLIIVGRKG